MIWWIHGTDDSSLLNADDANQVSLLGLGCWLQRCNYHLEDDTSIFILFGHSGSPAVIIFEFFPFPVVKLTIERWFPINLGTVYNMKWLVIPLQCILMPQLSILKSNILLFSPVICVLNIHHALFSRHWTSLRVVNLTQK